MFLTPFSHKLDYVRFADGKPCGGQAVRAFSDLGERPGLSDCGGLDSQKSIPFRMQPTRSAFKRSVDDLRIDEHHAPRRGFLTSCMQSVMGVTAIILSLWRNRPFSSRDRAASAQSHPFRLR